MPDIISKTFGIIVLICLTALFAGSPEDPVDDLYPETDSLVCVSDSLASAHQSAIFKDGVYTGESLGWTGMEVQIRIKRGILCRVRVLKARGTPEFYREVVQKLPRRIEKCGSADVDAISNATLSSESLKEAVRNALKKAADQTRG